MYAIALIVTPLIIFTGLSIWSNFSNPYIGLEEGRLRQCPSSPNCVCSESEKDDMHFIKPLRVADDTADFQEIATQAIRTMGGRIELESASFIHATFQTPIFRFKDDLELRFVENRMEIRSASRVGYSDLGANRKRVLELQSRIGDVLSSQSAR